MPKAVESPVTPEQLRDASKNYLRCLRLPKSSQVLIITDKLTNTLDIDPHFKIRNELSHSLENQIKPDHKVAVLEFEEKPTFDDLHRETTRLLKELDELNGKSEETTTIVYLGNDWEKRKGIYQAANEFGETHKVKFAGSLGFTTGDCRVMSQIGEQQLEQITQANEYFESFFKEKPQGRFTVTTRDLKGMEHKIDLDYDTTKAPFDAELGNLDGVHESPLGTFKNIRYVNIPGGEIYGSPFPFKKANGTFAAEGLTFTVKNGFLMHVDIDNSVDISKLSTSQQELIKRTQDAETPNNELTGKFLPIAELGLGYYNLAGIKTYSDSSTLTYEKSGPHIAFGNGFESPEMEELEKLSGEFRHSDFVLDHPVIQWSSLEGQEMQQFYPPIKK